MKVYGDTSVLVAWFHPSDQFAAPVTQWHRRHTFQFAWNPILRAELRHSLRRLSGRYAAIAWHAYSMSEASGRLTGDKHRLADLISWADELSARFASHATCGTWDFVHVAAAQHSKADVFATCDVAQAEVAKLAGVQGIQLFV